VKLQALGRQGLTGWRRRVADAAAPRLATTPAREETIRNWIGLAFLTVSAFHFGRTVARFLRER
jgi:hypothetical protein